MTVYITANNVDGMTVMLAPGLTMFLYRSDITSKAQVISENYQGTVLPPRNLDHNKHPAIRQVPSLIFSLSASLFSHTILMPSSSNIGTQLHIMVSYM